MTEAGGLAIRSKLTRVILLTCSVALLLACLVLAAYEAISFRQGLIRNMAVLADVLATNTTAALVFDDSGAAEETLAALKAEPDVMSASLLGPEGQLFATYLREGQQPEVVRSLPDGHRFEEGSLRLARPVALDGKRIGTIRLRADLQGMTERLILFAFIASLVLLGSLGVAFGVSSRLQRPIITPILQLVETARAVAERKNFSVRAAPQALKEFALLTDAFNQMLTGIEAGERALRTTNDTLTTEIAERSRAEAEARVSETRYRTLFDTLIEGFCTIEVIFDSAGRPVDYRFLEINPAFEKQTGLVGAQGRLMRELAPDHEAHWFELYGRIALTGESAHFQNEAKALGRHFDVFAYRIGGPESRKVAILFNDITERKEADDRVRAHLGRLELLSQITRAIGDRQDLHSIFQVVIGRVEEHLPVEFSCVCLHDSASNTLRVAGVGSRSLDVATRLGLTPGGEIDLQANGLAACLQGKLVYEPDIQQSTLELPRGLAACGLQALVAAPMLVDKKLFGLMITARGKAASFSSAECEFLRQVSDHAALAAHQAQLHGDLQSAYDELRQTQQAAMQQERLRALGQMASGIAHDINNAISPVSLYTESLLDTEPGLSPRARGYLTTIQRAIEDVAHTVARMREFYRDREPQLQMTPLSLNRLAQQVIDFSRARWSDMALARGIVIEVVTDLDNETPDVMGIESEIREALINLVFNAIDAMPGGGTLRLQTRSVERTAPLEPRRVRVLVTDTGVGMNDDTRRRCLEPFFTTKGERGTGLGLAMVYGVVQRHNATLTVDSEVGRGTSIGITFEAATNSVEERLEERAASLPGLRLLVVDDDPLLIASLREGLEGDGHLVETADGGQAGINAFRASAGRPFDAVITDLGMPFVDGRQVSEAIKAMSASTPVILLTGWGQRLVAEGDVPPHVDRVVNKPPRLRDIRVALAECLRPRST